MLRFRSKVTAQVVKVIACQQQTVVAAVKPLRCYFDPTFPARGIHHVDMVRSKSHQCYFSSDSSSNNNGGDGNGGNIPPGTKGSTKTPSKPIRNVDEIIAKEDFRPEMMLSRLDNDDELSQSFVTPEDPFGVLFKDGADRLGPSLPPIYERDSITGRLISEESNHNLGSSASTSATGMKQQQLLSDQDKHILSMDSVERDMKLLDSIKKHWQEKSKNPGTSGDTESSAPATNELAAIGERIRATDMATNVLGRSVHGQKVKEILEDGTEVISRETDHNFSQPLTLEEYQAFEQFMKKKHNVNISVDDIPVSTQQKPNPIQSSIHAEANRAGRMETKKEEIAPVHPDEEEFSLKWLTSRAQRQMDDNLDDNPFSDLMPGDLSPKRVVNRKAAKIIPTKLLNYNNMSLLQHFIGPTGLIMNRTQTRLGARDQRRIARLIKRSRALGLLPIIGQFKVENHGWIHSKDINETRKWENQIEQRGLVIQSQQQHQYEQEDQLSKPPNKPRSTSFTSALPLDES